MGSFSNQSKSFRILVVDDEQALRVLLQRQFRQWGHHCDAAGDGRQALELFRKQPYHVVVTDLRMPEGNGHALSTALLGMPQPPGIVVLTGVVEPRLAKDLKARGVDEIIYKPAIPNELIPLVEAIARRRSLRLSDESSPSGDSPDGNQLLQTEEPVAAEPPEPRGESRSSPELVTTASWSQPADASGMQCRVAVLMYHRVTSTEYANAIRSPHVDAVPCASADILRQLLDSGPANIIVIEHDLGGFLTGLEIVERLCRELYEAEFILLADEPDHLQVQADALGVRSILESSAGPVVVADAVNSLQQSIESDVDFIPQAARLLAEKCSDIPPLPQVLINLLRYMEMDLLEIPLDELAHDISLDARATVDVLRFANSSSVGASFEIVRVTDAVKLLGPKRTTSLVFAAAVMTAGQQLAKTPDLREWYQQRCVLIATTASVFAERLETISAEMVFTIAMLQEIGIMALATRDATNYLSLIERVRSTGIAHLERIEQQELGFTHADVGAALLQKWNLPRSVVKPVLEHHVELLKSRQPTDVSVALNRVLRIGEAVADLKDVPHASRQSRLNRILSDYGASNAKSCQAVLQQAAARAAENSRLFNVPVPDLDTLQLLLEQACQTEFDERHDEYSTAAVSL